MNLQVIGAGAGGMAAALLAQSQGEQVTLFEAHSQPGGCAGWFRREGFSFDAGATTLSGVQPGQPLHRWAQLTGAPLRLVAADPGIVFHFPDGVTLRRWRDHEAWMAELNRIFPNVNHVPFWKKCEEISRDSWSRLPALTGFPPRSWEDLSHIPAWLRSAPLLPYLGMSLETLVRLYGQPNERWWRWVNALCMISAQNHANHIPALVGALAMTYPSETYVPVGGMEGLFSGWLDRFVELGGEWRPRTRKEPDGEGTWITNRTGWDTGEAIPAFSWGAFTIYGAVQAARPLENYHLVMGEKDFFVSFSLAGDTSRAPAGWQAVTISCHEHDGQWSKDADYAQRKKSKALELWQAFLGVFGDALNESRMVSAGTPHTFARYTGRFQGRVGGIPHSWSFPLWRWPGTRTSDPRIWRVGDTVFPGQGIAAVVQGALMQHQLRRGLSLG